MHSNPIPIAKAKEHQEQNKNNSTSSCSIAQVPLRELVLEGAAADWVPPHGQRQDPVEAEPELGREQPEPRPPPHAATASICLWHVGGSVHPYQKNSGKDRAREQPVRNHPLRPLRHEQRWAAGDAVSGHPFPALLRIRMEAWNGWPGNHWVREVQEWVGSRWSTQP